MKREDSPGWKIRLENLRKKGTFIVDQNGNEYMYVTSTNIGDDWRERLLPEIQYPASITFSKLKKEATTLNLMSDHKYQEEGDFYTHDFTLVIREIKLR